MKKQGLARNRTILAATVITLGVLVISVLVLNRRLPPPLTDSKAKDYTRSVISSHEEIDALRKRAMEAEQDVDTLLTVVRQQRDLTPNKPLEVNSIEQLTAKIKEAKQLTSARQFREALSLYLALWDVGWIGQTTLSRDMLLRGLGDLGTVYPEAIAATRQLRDAAFARASTYPSDRQASLDVVLANNRLADGSHTVAMYESLTRNDPRRQSIATVGITAFVDARLYDAIVEAKPFGSMLNEFEGNVRRGESMGGSTKDYIVIATSRNIEALIGAGLVEEAATLTRKLLKYDDSKTTSAVIQQHVDRAKMSPKR